MVELPSTFAESVASIGTWSDPKTDLRNTSEGSASFLEFLHAGLLPDGTSESPDLLTEVLPTGGRQPRRISKAVTATEDSCGFPHQSMIGLVTSANLFLSYTTLGSPDPGAFNLERFAFCQATDSVQPGGCGQASAILPELAHPGGGLIGPLIENPASMGLGSIGTTLGDEIPVEHSSSALDVLKTDSRDDTEVGDPTPEVAASKGSSEGAATSRVREPQLPLLEGNTQDDNANLLPSPSAPNDAASVSARTIEPKTPSEVQHTQLKRIDVPKHNETSSSLGETLSRRDSGGSRTRRPVKPLDAPEVTQLQVEGPRTQLPDAGITDLPNGRVTALSETHSGELLSIRASPSCEVACGPMAFSLVFDHSVPIESQTAGDSDTEVDPRSVTMPDLRCEPDLDTAGRPGSRERLIQDSRVPEPEISAGIATLHKPFGSQIGYGPAATDQVVPVVASIINSPREETANRHVGEEDPGLVWSKMDSLNIGGDPPTHFDASQPLTSIQVMAPGQERVSVRVLEAPNGVEVRVSTEDREARQILLNGIDELINRVRGLSLGRLEEGASQTPFGDSLTGGRRQDAPNQEGRRGRSRKPAVAFSIPSIATGAPPVPTLASVS